MFYLLRKYQDQVLLSLTLLFIAGLVTAYVIGINSIATNVESAIHYNVGSQESARFNIDEAQKLNFKGLELPR